MGCQVIPFDFPWWLWLILSLGFGWIASVITNTDWGEGSGKFIANALRLILVVLAVACGILGVAFLIQTL